MARDGTGWRRAYRAIDRLVVVGGALVAVSAGGVAWSYLRVGSVAPTYVREAQFVAGLLVLLAWTVRNRPGRRAGGGDRSRHGTTPSDPPSRRFEVYRRLAGGPPVRMRESPALDGYLLLLGVLLLVLSLGGEVLGPPPPG